MLSPSTNHKLIRQFCDDSHLSAEKFFSSDEATSSSVVSTIKQNLHSASHDKMEMKIVKLNSVFGAMIR